MSLTKPAIEEIRQELIKEGFAEKVEDTLQLIILEIDQYREDDEYSIGNVKGGVVERLIEKFSADRYQQVSPLMEYIELEIAKRKENL